MAGWLSLFGDECKNQNMINRLQKFSDDDDGDGDDDVDDDDADDDVRLSFLYIQTSHAPPTRALCYKSPKSPDSTW